MRLVVFVTLWLSAAVAHADALPTPGRPEWSDTPMPMPSGPDVAVRVALVLLAVLAAAAVILRRRTRRA